MSEAPAVASMPPEVQTPPAKKRHPIELAIDQIVHHTLDIQVAVDKFIPLAKTMQQERVDQLIEELQKAVDGIKEGTARRPVVLSALYNTKHELEKLIHSRLAKIVEDSLFLGLFSRLDAFLGQLLLGLYEIRPELFDSLQGTVDYSDILSATSLDSLKTKILSEEIEALRRKSYGEQFSYLEKRFNIKLTDFTRWKDFIEASQRRNLLTHCDGIVSEQYIATCAAIGIDSQTLPKAGTKIDLGKDYFIQTCGIVAEVSIKLGQTLWRKTIPSQVDQANGHLVSLLYNALYSRDWLLARMIGEFGMSLRITSDESKKIVLINFAQALKRTGKWNEAKTLIESVDWSASRDDFRLARAVLMEDDSDAASLMRRIGKAGEVQEMSYHTWPLFNEFRETSAFQDAYESIFGYPYAAKAKEDATKASEKGEKQGIEASPEAGVTTSVGSAV